jgi:pantoate--beta-alanine ligase
VKIIRDPAQMQRLSRLLKQAGSTIGFVPTMGALHLGHLRLIETARAKNKHLIVSIYVNPTQFGPQEDLRVYPRPLQRDLALCRGAGVDVLFHPASLYAEDHSTWVVEEKIAHGRCATTRPGHFRGVATVVLKLLNIVQPDRAYFGWKDAQQVEVIQRLVRDLAVPTQIIPLETVRDRDGLALSSRNQYLSPTERTQALALPLLLAGAIHQPSPVAWLRRTLPRCPGVKLDYVEKTNGRLCAAVWVGKTRLIDNLPCP